jgi:hypothetical protein
MNRSSLKGTNMQKKKEKRFVVKEEQSLGLSSVQILADTATGVHYLLVSGIHGLSGMTPLLDEQGQVVVDKSV